MPGILNAENTMQLPTLKEEDSYDLYAHSLTNSPLTPAMPTRLHNLPGFSIDQVAAAAGTDSDILRLENLDTDLRPPQAAIEATRIALERDADNSYLPFTGQWELRQAVANKLHRSANAPYSPAQVVITCGATEAMLDALLAVTDPGDEVILTDPTYAGMIYRVRLAGAVPRLVPFRQQFGEWRLDVDALQQAVSPRTKAVFILNPAMPCGAVLTLAEWQAIAKICIERDLWLIYNAAFERVLFDQRKVIHPAALPGMAGRTITLGSVSKEYGMIGWRVGWMAAPESIVADLAKVHIYNVVTPVGISQAGALAALQTDESEVLRRCRILEERRDVVCEQLAEYAMIPAQGGWSQLVDVSPLGLTGQQASERLLQKGKVAATPMTHWGEVNAAQFVRLVFSNEPVERLQTLGRRFRAALGK